MKRQLPSREIEFLAKLLLTTGTKMNLLTRIIGLALLMSATASADYVTMQPSQRFLLVVDGKNIALNDDSVVINRDGKKEQFQIASDWLQENLCPGCGCTGVDS